MSESISRDHENDQPVLETHDKRMETRACDLIDRQAAIDEVVAWLKDYMTDKKNGKPLTDRLKDLPSAQPDDEEANYWREKANSYEQTLVKLSQNIAEQPEIIHCRDCKWHNEEINQCNAQICASMCGEDFCSRAERREE